MDFKECMCWIIYGHAIFSSFPTYSVMLINPESLAKPFTKLNETNVINGTFALLQWLESKGDKQVLNYVLEIVQSLLCSLCIFFLLQFYELVLIIPILSR